MILLDENDPVWKTKEGDRIPLQDIDDNHLLNIRRFIYKVRENHRSYLRERHAHNTMWGNQYSMANQNLKIIQNEIDIRNLDDPEVKLSVPMYND